jgi:hypothetical protein
VIGLVALALLLGRTSLAGVARFGRQYGTPLALGFKRGKTPATATLRRFAAAAFEALLARWIAGRVDPAASDRISLDGKTLRGSRDGDVPGQHLVAAYAHAVTAVLGRLRVDAKTNEHTAALERLGLLPVKGKVVVGDALFCQRDLAEQVADSGGDSVFTVKDNRPGLGTDIRAGFGFAAAARQIAAATSP